MLLRLSSAASRSALVCSAPRVRLARSCTTGTASSLAVPVTSATPSLGAGSDAASTLPHTHHKRTPSEGPLSFIDRVKAFGVNAMLGAFVSTGSKFDRVLDGMSVKEVASGRVLCELTIAEGLQNAYSSLHGGATCTIVDVVGTMALLTVDPSRAGVSVELSVSFVSAAKAGETIQIEGRVLKTGKRLGFTQVDIYRLSDHSLVASGRHTKAL